MTAVDFVAPMASTGYDWDAHSNSVGTAIDCQEKIDCPSAKQALAGKIFDRASRTFVAKVPSEQLDIADP